MVSVLSQKFKSKSNLKKKEKLRNQTSQVAVMKTHCYTDKNDPLMKKNLKLKT
jgi:hypothetical protein